MGRWALDPDSAGDVAATAPAFDRWQRTVADAAAGDAGAVARLAASPDDSRAAVAASRMGGILYSRALACEVDGPAVEEWGLVARSTAIRRMLLDQALFEVGGILDDAGVPWLPLKGMGLPEGTYERLEERPTSDLDLLVAPADFERAAGALREAGWTAVNSDPMAWQWTLEDGYNWQAVGTLPVVLELHFRLWGSITETFVLDLLRRTHAAPARGREALAIAPPDAAIIAAVHVWQTPVPRPLLFLWDLHRLVDHVLDQEGREALVSWGCQAGLQIYLALSLLCVTRLWPSEVNAALAHRCVGATRRFERRLLRRAAGRDWDRISLGHIVGARLLDRRPSRTGWRAPLRSVWPHPGLLATRYPDIPGRVRRRLRFLVSAAGHPARLLRKR